MGKQMLFFTSQVIYLLEKDIIYRTNIPIERNFLLILLDNIPVFVQYNYIKQ